MPEEQEDESIIFPDFSARFPVLVGRQNDQPYELDGVTLQAIAIAANDYIPTGSRSGNCWDRQDTQNYRVIRQGDVIFVSIFQNPARCDQLFLDGGMRYAISTDGRILRRLATGEPDGSRLKPSDAGVREYQGDPMPDSMVGSTQLGAPSFIPPQWRKDGGSSVSPQLPLPSAWDGGSPLDGGATP
jgi:hypothetical protein